MATSTLLDSPKYRRFIAERDQTLEKILQNAQTDISRMLFESLSQIEGTAASLAMKSDKTFHSTFGLSQEMENQTLAIFSKLIFPLVARIQRMRRATFTLTTTAEMEAIGQATQKKVYLTGQKHKHKLSKVDKDTTLTDDALDKRVWIALMKLRGNIMHAFRLALLQELSPPEVLDKVRKAFPKIVSYKRPPRELKPLREASTPKDPKDKQEFSFDFVDPDDWELATQAYQDSELPPSRFDRSPEIDPDAGYYKYNWELEQELNDDFVQQVRSGQIDAANELGIQEFVWVAIIDDKTDDCCLHRNGMTTSEIEIALDSGKLDADDCDAVSPPAHHNCRCQLAPVASTDEVQGPDWKSFNDWLNT